MHLRVTTTKGKFYTIAVPRHKEVRDVILAVRDYGIESGSGAKKEDIAPREIKTIEIRADPEDDKADDPDDFYCEI